MRTVTAFVAGVGPSVPHEAAGLGARTQGKGSQEKGSPLALRSGSPLATAAPCGLAGRRKKACGRELLLHPLLDGVINGDAEPVGRGSRGRGVSTMLLFLVQAPRSCRMHSVLS